MLLYLRQWRLPEHLRLCVLQLSMLELPRPVRNAVNNCDHHTHHHHDEYAYFPSLPLHLSPTIAAPMIVCAQMFTNATCSAQAPRCLWVAYQAMCVDCQATNCLKMDCLYMLREGLFFSQALPSQHLLLRRRVHRSQISRCATILASGSPMGPLLPALLQR